MTWTAEKPTAPGYYWNREHENSNPVIILFDTDGTWIQMGFRGTEISLWTPPNPMWAGPILPPTEEPT